MDALAVHVASAFGWVLRATAQGAVIVAAILLVQQIARQRLPARWHSALWLILLVRLVLPWMPESPVSLFNLLPRQDAKSFSAWPAQVRTALTPGRTSDGSDAAVAPVAGARGGSYRSSGRRGELSLVQSKAGGLGGWMRAHVMEACAAIWLAGMVLFGAVILIENTRFWRRMLRDRPVTDSVLLNALEECKKIMGVRAPVVVIASEAAASPALFGFVRPRLLIPKGMAESVDIPTFRYVALHEMAHLKRHDIAVNWIATFMQIIHWFNPALWYAFHRMRMDRELACDALVLSRTEPSETQGYGNAILNLFEHASRVRRIPGMAGILENESQLKRRITMIALFKKPSMRWTVAAAVLVMALAAVLLTNARAQTESPASPGAPASAADAAKLRAECQNHLKQLGLVCKMFANEQRSGIWPPLHPQPGRLMFPPEKIYPEWLTDPTVMACPALKPAATNPADLIDDQSYFYLGFATMNEEEGMAFIEAYRTAAKEGRTFGQDLPTPAGAVGLGRERILRLREGVERFFITDINDPAAAGKTQSSIPVIVERPGHHTPDGGNVLYMDGHVEFIRYPGKYPMTERFIKGLEELDKLSDLPPTPEAEQQPSAAAGAPPAAGLAESNPPGLARGGNVPMTTSAAAYPAARRTAAESMTPKEPTELEKKLDQPVDIEFQDIHISEIAEFIADSYDINIVLDSRVIVPPRPAKTTGTPGAETSGAVQDPLENPFAEYVTDGKVPYISLKNVPLREALKAVVTPLSLDFKVEPNYVFVSTREILDGGEP